MRHLNVFAGSIGSNGIQPIVDASDLHKMLSPSSDFFEWIDGKIASNRLVDGVDFGRSMGGVLLTVEAAGAILADENDDIDLLPAIASLSGYMPSKILPPIIKSFKEDVEAIVLLAETIEMKDSDVNALALASFITHYPHLAHMIHHQRLRTMYSKLMPE